MFNAGVGVALCCDTMKNIIRVLNGTIVYQCNILLVLQSSRNWIIRFANLLKLTKQNRIYHRIKKLLFFILFRYLFTLFRLNFIYSFLQYIFFT